MDIIDHHSIGFETAGSNPFKSCSCDLIISLTNFAISKYVEALRRLEWRR